MSRLDKALSNNTRTLLVVILSLLTFTISSLKFYRDGFFTPIWERTYGNFSHFAIGLGHTGEITISLPSAIPAIVAILLIFFAFKRQVLDYPNEPTPRSLIFLTCDFLVLTGLTKLYIFGGDTFELLYYAAAFGGGAYLAGSAKTSRFVLLGLLGILLLRLIFIEALYPYIFVTPLLGAMYIYLRIGFSMESFEKLNKTRKGV